MFDVTFIDNAHGIQEIGFETFDEAAEYWQDYADTPTCVYGELVDSDNGEVIWHFDDRAAE